MAVELTHNFDGSKFMWLYAKYANGCNPEKHCTNAIRGKYSKRFSRLNEEFKPGQAIVMNEFLPNTWDAIYICGVAKKGYSQHKNYDHNVHVAIIPKEGAKDHWEFEGWRMDLKNGFFEYVISEDELDSQYKSLPSQYTTCRMFRWAVSHYKNQIG